MGSGSYLHTCIFFKIYIELYDDTDLSLPTRIKYKTQKSGKNVWTNYTLPPCGIANFHKTPLYF